MALGKITELPFHFYRLVVNEHSLLVPVLLYFISRLIQLPPRRGAAQGGVGRIEPTPPYPPAGRDLALTGLLFILLSLNLTRIYLVALILGLACLFTRSNWKRWLTYSFFSLLFFLFSFSSVHFIASRGQSLGWELFGVRLQSIASPQIEDSSLSRLLLLPKILDKIKAHPLLGEGLGATVTVYSPIFKQTITTPNFDWGYLEIIGEMGIIGLVIWIVNIGYLILVMRKNILTNKQFYFASLGALLVINLTSPALFHVFGVIWTTYLFAKTSNQCNPHSQSV